MHAFGYSKIVYLKKYTKVICPSDIKNERPLAFTTSCFVYLFIHLFIYLFQTNRNVFMDSAYGRISCEVRDTVWILKFLHK